MTICRQYYIALIPAAAGAVILSLTIAIVPLLALVSIWKGITSPSMAAGTSYNIYHAEVGLNFWWPIVASFCIGFSFPFTFSSMVGLQSSRRSRVCLAASIIRLTAVPFRKDIVNIGVLHSVIEPMSRMHLAGTTPVT